MPGLAPQGRVSPSRHLAGASRVGATLLFHSRSLSARLLSALLLVEGGGVITYFEGLEQQSHELSKAEDATTAALRLPSRPPHRARHLQPGIRASSEVVAHCLKPSSSSTSPATMDSQSGCDIGVLSRASIGLDIRSLPQSGMHRAELQGRASGVIIAALLAATFCAWTSWRSSSSSEEGVRSRRHAEELGCQGDVFSMGDVGTAPSPSRPSTR